MCTDWAWWVPARHRGPRLPGSRAKVWLGDDGEIIARADFLWRRYRTIGEADGALKYENPARAQLERDARLRAAGYEVVHFTWREITLVPAQVVDTVRLAFTRSGAPRQGGEARRSRVLADPASSPAHAADEEHTEAGQPGAPGGLGPPGKRANSSRGRARQP